MRFPLSGNLKTRIAAVAGLLFMAGVGLLILLVVRQLHDDMQAVLARQQLATANYIARDIDGKLGLRMDSLKRVAGNVPPELLADPATLQQWLEDRRAIHTLFPTGLMIVPPDGGPTLAETPRLATRPKSFTDRDWFIGAKNSKQAVFSKPLITRATGEPALVVATPMLAPNGELLGILAGITPFATPGFLDLINGSRPGKNGSYQLLSPQHRLFALGSDPGIASRPLPEPGSDPILDDALNGAIGILIRRNARDEEEIAAIVEIPRSGWLLILRQPTAEVFEPLHNTIRNILLLTVIIGIPLTLILLIILTRLLQPLAKLSRQLRDMAEGNRPMQPVAIADHDEVAEVAHAFNHLQSKLIEQERYLASMALHDSLTGLPNRSLIAEQLARELQRNQRNTHRLALLFLDLDGFKPVNDRYGHQIGDALLIQVAGRLRGVVREIDTVARLGGDEFLILLTDCDVPQTAAERVAVECIAALDQPFAIAGHQIRIGVSIGIAWTDQNASNLTPDTLVSHADHAMYRAKAAGRNQFALHDAASTKESLPEDA